MLILTSSPDAVAPGGIVRADVVKVLTAVRAAGNPVGILSNHPEPAWFKQAFAGTNVQFVRAPGRQDGKILSQNAQKFNLSAHDVLVLAAKAEDIQMGKNGGAVLIAAGWCAGIQVQALGIRVNTTADLQEVISLTAQWGGHWWFAGNAAQYRVRALADLSAYGKPVTQQEFSTKVTQTVKSGGVRLTALLAVTARSLLVEKLATQSNLVWGVYPSSKSKNDDSEVLSDFAHRLRTTVSRVRYAQRGEPLFIRHMPSAKRSAGGGGSRTDPAGQVETMHLNPYYREKSRLVGKHVIVVDDVTTYGLSFGVAAGFLRKAGAADVTGVALGKFGNQLRQYNVVIHSDPFAPVKPGNYSGGEAGWLSGATNSASQGALLTLIP